MAFQVRKIDPLDLQPRKAIGVSLPFSGRAVFTSTYQSKDATKINLINYFLTAKGERYLNPYFGNGLQTMLFEQLTETVIRQLESQIRNDIGIFFPTVVVGELIVEGIPDSNTVQLFMKYQIRSTGISDEVTINFL